MLIITPSPGSVPEPRPQYLVTGDRATLILDAASSAALQSSGVSLTTLSLSTFNQLVEQLVPESLDGVDPVTGKLLPAVMPDYASQAAINALNLLDPNLHTVEEQFIPPRLSQTSIQSMVNAQSSTVVTTDPDGYPVIEGGASTETDLTVSGTLTANVLSAATGHSDTFTANQATMTYTESAAFVTDNQSTEPGAPAAGKLKIYSDQNGRVVFKDQNAELYHASGKRIVTAWPAALDSYLGDEAILSTTGEHRIYLGATKGWRLASPFEVSSLTDRDAISSKYPGMRVFVAYGHEQEHVYGSDNKWHGTKAFTLTPQVFYASNVNDTNPRTRWNVDIVDPGFPYEVGFQCGFAVDTPSQPSNRVYAWAAVVDYQSPTNTGSALMAWSFQDSKAGTMRFDFGALTNAGLTGSHSARIYWSSALGNANANSQNFWDDCVFQVLPA